MATMNPWSKVRNPGGYDDPNGAYYAPDTIDVGGAQLPYWRQDRARLGGMLDGQSPFAGQEWGGLISQLQQQASGQGPSLAQDAYRKASADQTAALGSMSQGSATPGAARQAMIQQGRTGQGMAAGLATARTQEQLGAQGALAQALGARDQLNQGAYLNVLAQQLGLSEAQLRAMMGNQQYAVGMASAPQKLSKGERIASSLGQIWGGVAKGG